MKRNQLFFIPFLLFFVGSMACKTDIPMAEDKPIRLDSTGNNNSSNRLRIQVGSYTFTATLLNNATVTAFKTRLPITLSMNELNRNEKYAELPAPLPTNAANPRAIQTGDLMLYGSTTLVLFYEPFQTTYSYTKLGHVDNSEGLATAPGSGNVTVTFELE
ncbi:cyclophilin-like fold protein [Spirosoma endbachense]|uniref:Cyclophilin-like domain-containing protein n=1 Tax=Spirosoma endbachense TaxID=2666025 RepID=A0A6P1W0P4_9BACT|nr:cyclophilin-like fold protein [Spirosoma endbachense]QHV98158.1 hypothetical protein GJR95_25530 [Spirosoma endbachense]